ncbi:uncharacterized protein LOC143022189 [Oratosquilla oratoria]|uniref:uncharacterized protein LOC143022189 n=1 Tax=Oratosquilla oratoria TaxID=337810 RepID=UPI003F75AC1F
MKLLLEMSWEWNQEKYAVFIDLEKAFDRVPRERLWNTLQHEEYNIPPKLIRAVKSILDGTKNKVKCKEVDIDWFEVMTGLRQGGVISPLLFIIYMNRCMKDICVEYGDNKITLAYVDDTPVVTSTEEQL